jgi:hypothetical protein
VEWEKVDGRLHVRTVRRFDHSYGSKTIPTGFFDLPGAENISAVLFSNAGTIAKFDRMGVVAGFAAPDTLYFRSGFRFNPEPNATDGIHFSDDITSPDYKEFWSDELQLFHNPNAKIPLPPEWFADLTQHWFKDGDHYSITPEGHVLASMTMVTSYADEKTAGDKTAT